MEKELAEIKKKIEEAAKIAHRDPKEITLLAVSKTMPIEALEEADRLFHPIFGENHVQEILVKSARHPEYTFDLIGHLQTNKVKKIVGRVRLIQSVDSVHLAEKISEEACKLGIRQSILLEINITGEEAKTGFPLSSAEDAIRKIAVLPGLSIEGLMAVGKKTADPEENRPLFRLIYQLSIDIMRKKIDNVKMNVLSMGMTADYTVAIEEGATLIRIGTGLFGERSYAKRE